MTTDELRAILATTEQALTANQQIVQPDILDDMARFVDEMKKARTSGTIPAKVGVAGDIDLDKLLAGLSNAIEVERKLIGKEGNTLIKVCDNLQKRNFILALLARFI